MQTEQHLERIFETFPQAKVMYDAGVTAIDSRFTSSEELFETWFLYQANPTEFEKFENPIGILESENLQSVRHIAFWDYDDYFRDTAGSTMGLFGVPIINEPLERHERLTYDGSADSDGIITPRFTLREVVIGLLATGNVKNMHDVDASQRIIQNSAALHGNSVLHYIITAAQPGTEKVTVQSAFDLFGGIMKGISFTYNPDDEDESLGKKSDAMQQVLDAVQAKGGSVDSVSFGDDSPSHIYDFEKNFIAKNGIDKYIHRTPMHAMNRSSYGVNHSLTASQAVQEISNFIDQTFEITERDKDG